jgi:AAA family ATP:ADP antiporter
MSQGLKKLVYNMARRLVMVEPFEAKALLWSFSYFFALLCGYYILRPLRDEMGIAGGIDKLQWLFTATFVAMLAIVPLFGWLTSRFTRKHFLPVVYYFFIANVLVFYLLFESHLTHAYVARAFFIWVSVFNLFVVSVFWSFMSDIFSDPQARRLYGFIAAGGTSGALAGPLLTSALAQSLGTANLLLLSAGFLFWAVFSIHRLIAWHDQRMVQHDDEAGARVQRVDEAQRIGGGILNGIALVLRSPYLFGIAVVMLFYTALSTFLYFQQAHIVKANFSDPATRTAVFANIDLAVNSLTLLVQFFFVSRFIKWLGIAWTLAAIPLLLSVCFVALALAPVLAVLITVQVVRRAGNYAVMRPAREMLYVVVGREEKYKAKNFNDTVVYRGGDAVSAWLFTGLRDLGLTLSHIAWVAVPMALVWAAVSYALGRRQRVLADAQQKTA